MTLHRLKTWPDPFRATWAGHKLHEVRRADRDYRPGDEVELVEYEPALGSETGRSIRARITYLSSAGTWGLPSDVCVFSLLVLERREARAGWVDERYPRCPSPGCNQRLDERGNCAMCDLADGTSVRPDRVRP